MFFILPYSTSTLVSISRFGPAKQDKFVLRGVQFEFWAGLLQQ